MSITQIEEIIIDLISPTGAKAGLSERLARLCADDWAILHDRAEQHRLLPMLHHRAVVEAKLDIPAHFAVRWREAARISTMAALLHQRDLLDAIACLETADIEPIALKGVYLAFEAYPEPGLRPMRDIDLWISEHRALEAHQLLLQAGYEALTPGDPKALLGRHHQLPVLIAPSGDTLIEIHTRLFHATVSEDPSVNENLVANSRHITLAGRPVRVPSSEHLLLHLIIHAAYDHRFDNGPLILSDVGYLTAHDSIDWLSFHKTTGAFARGSDMLLRFANKRWPEARIPDRDDDEDDPEIMALLPQLIVQDLDVRDAARIAVQPHRIGNLFPDRSRTAQLYGESIANWWPLSWLRHWWRLIMQRLPLFLSARSDPKAATLAAADATYRDWLTKASDRPEY